jgi:hypothetical protein
MRTPSSPTVSLVTNNRYEIGKDAEADQSAQLSGHCHTGFCASLNNLRLSIERFPLFRN